MVVTYDEHGGFFDHVVPPSLNVPPPGDGHASYPDSFAFDRLGLRVPTLLISPWIAKVGGMHDPRGGGCVVHAADRIGARRVVAALYRQALQQQVMR
jgi:phospholipase C